MKHVIALVHGLCVFICASQLAFANAKANPLPDVDFDATPVKGSAPLLVTFNNLTNPDAVAELESPEWSWDFGDGATSNKRNPKHTYTMPGNYTVKCTLSAEGKTKKLKRERYIVVKPVVDANLVAWSTYLGGALGATDTWDTAVDPDGNLIVGGTSAASDLPTTDGAYDETHNGDYDMYVAKFSGEDGSLLWATYIGDDSYEEVEGLLVLNSGEIIVNGYAFGSFTAPNTTSIGTGFSNSGSIVMLSLSSDGSTINKTLFFGGESSDVSWERNRVGVDAAGNYVITGYTYSSQFPVTEDAYQTEKLGTYDAFVAKVSSDLDEIIWATYLGGSGLELGKAVAIDGSDAVYVTGATASPDFPTTDGAYDTVHASNYDGFITKIASDGTDLVYSTFVGGSLRDRFWDIALTETNEAIVAGFSHSTDLVLPPGGYSTKNKGIGDILVCKLNADGSDLTAATLLGGKGDEVSLGMAVDGAGNIWLSGSTNSTKFPLTSPTYQPKYKGGPNDCYVAAFDPSLTSLVFSTYLGGSGDDLDGHISVDTDGNPLVAGITSSTDFPTTAGTPQPDYPGAQSIFVAKIDMENLKRNKL
ncbi:MAG: PKD domain-containing protein [Candidatus Hydrogenedentes bacterium]|nr:PKD domain-containing protein [Candidatus Hydrogenedentota bacterium]